MTAYCSMTLQGNRLLSNYYNHNSIEVAIDKKYVLPNAMYLDAVDSNGTIRVGPENFDYGVPR